MLLILQLPNLNAVLKMTQLTTFCRGQKLNYSVDEARKNHFLFSIVKIT